MIRIGETQTLTLHRFTDHGAYLICEDNEEVLLPNKYLNTSHSKNDLLEVFVYNDSEDRPIAVTDQPFAQKGEFACLRVKDTNKMGAFLDWGLEKDLLLPFSEQSGDARPGQWKLVYITIDPKSDRLYATSKLRPFLSDEIKLQDGQEVKLLIGGTRELGTQVVIDNQYLGMLYHNEVFEDIRKGESRTGYVKKVREDGKIDVSLRKTGLVQLEEGAQRILSALNENSGKLDLHDKSDPDYIQQKLQMSKKSFKRSLGILYKQKLVKIGAEGIELINQ